MTVALDKDAVEESTFIISLSFRDELNQPVTPLQATWTLSTESGDVVNNRENIPVVPLESDSFIVLTGPDLALPDSDDRTRLVLIQSSYNSVKYGSNLQLNEEVSFKITDLKTLS